MMQSSDALIGDVMRQFQQINHPFIGVLTGKSVYNEDNEDNDGDNKSTLTAHRIKKRAAGNQQQLAGKKPENPPCFVLSFCSVLFCSTLLDHPSWSFLATSSYFRCGL